MAGRTEEHQEEERREQSRPNVPPASISSGKKRRKPRGALLHGNDPTLAKRAEEELRTFGR